jgi:hypothetical protein
MFITALWMDSDRIAPVAWQYELAVITSETYVDRIMFDGWIAVGNAFTQSRYGKSNTR